MLKHTITYPCSHTHNHTCYPDFMCTRTTHTHTHTHTHMCVSGYLLTLSQNPSLPLPPYAEEISGHVWMIPVYLLQDEEEELKAYRRNMSDHDSVYNTLRSSTGSLPFSSGASFFARFSHSNPPRASKKGGVVHTKVQVSPQASTRRSIFHRSTDVDRTYEDVTDAVEVLKQSKLQSGEKVAQSGFETPPPPPFSAP